MRESIEIRPKKSSLVSENQPVKFYHSPARIVQCVSEYIFQFQKTNKQAKNKNTKKEKETKEERRIPQENRLKKKIAIARVKIFLVTRISGKKSFFSLV